MLFNTGDGRALVARRLCHYNPARLLYTENAHEPPARSPGKTVSSGPAGPICQGLAGADGAANFIEDSWQRPAGGGGRSRVLTGGAVFEQAGVNFSHVSGDALPASPPRTARSWPAAASRPWACRW